MEKDLRRELEFGDMGPMTLMRILPEIQPCSSSHSRSRKTPMARGRPPHQSQSLLYSPEISHRSLLEKPRFDQDSWRRNAAESPVYLQTMRGSCINANTVGGFLWKMHTLVMALSLVAKQLRERRDDIGDVRSDLEGTHSSLQKLASAQAAVRS